MDLLSWFKRSTAKGNPAKESVRPVHATPFAGAEVIPRKDCCCDAVRAIAGRRFLSREVPLIPLRDCDQPNCACTYRRYAERRTSVRRAVDLGAGFDSRLGQQSDDRRRAHIPGRRAADAG